jgi:hypothetical protein
MWLQLPLSAGTATEITAATSCYIAVLKPEMCFALSLPRHLNVDEEHSHPISSVAPSHQFKIETLFYLTNAVGLFVSLAVSYTAVP